MAEGLRKKPYWRQTRLLMLSSLALPLVLIAGLAFWAERFSEVVVAGAPLGFLLAVHGVAGLSIAAVARYAAHQERIDRLHGASDEG
jgi:putative solute:sodium symporter small subunit